MIDLRSDTLTIPTQGMREAMVSAPVGDDVFGEDPTVAELEDRVCALFGHEAALFCSSGSLANQLAVGLQVPVGSEVLCDAWAHIARAEMGGHAALHGITMRTFHTPAYMTPGVLDPDSVGAMIADRSSPYLVSTALVAVENTHNFAGGTVQPLDALRALAAHCDSANVAMHLDGARLPNAMIASGTTWRDYGELFSSISLCLSKGLGAPIGSVLSGPRSFIEQARVLRKRLGGGWRQAGVLAAAGLYALENHVDRLAEDHLAASAFAEAVNERIPGLVSQDPQTNIVLVDTQERSAPDLARLCASEGVAVIALSQSSLRAVTYLGISLDDAVTAGRTLADCIEKFDHGVTTEFSR